MKVGRMLGECTENILVPRSDILLAGIPLHLIAYYLNGSSDMKPVGHFGIHTQHDYDKATKIRHFKIGDNCIDIGRYGPLRKQDRKVRLTGWKVWNLNSLFSPKTCAQQSSA